MEWKNADKEPPDNDREVFISDGKNYGSGRYLRSSNIENHWFIYFASVYTVRFWCEIPLLPKS